MSTSTSCFPPARVYRIAQETVTNALKHGVPTHVLVELATTGSGLELTITDDGSGVSSGVSEGVGLRSMRHRAELVGGMLSLELGAESGTTVRVQVPIRA